jgi:hypothetical protein
VGGRLATWLFAGLAVSGCTETTVDYVPRPIDAGTDVLDGTLPPPIDTIEWDIFALRVVTGRRTDGTDWDPEGDAELVVRATRDDIDARTDVRTALFGTSLAGAVYLEPLVEATPGYHLLGEWSVQLVEMDEGTEELVASCTVDIGEEDVGARLLRTRCEEGASDYDGVGFYDIVLGFRATGDRAPALGDGPSVWELRLSSLETFATDEDGSSWDPDGTGPDPTVLFVWPETIDGEEVLFPFELDLPDDVMSTTALDPPIVIARLPDDLSAFGTRDANAWTVVFDRDPPDRVPIGPCVVDELNRTAFADLPSLVMDGRTPVAAFCLFPTIDEAAWQIEGELVRFGDGWL